ncbi:Phosphohistidine phosphatase SixA [Klebsiella pneumoniae IS22]|nr:Phosphohistidine phosphatase SixA [Klebsiella pneumoniae IS22]
MQVFIMRHGDAALDAASDSVRPLTTNGCDESPPDGELAERSKSGKSNAFW